MITSNHNQNSPQKLPPIIEQTKKCYKIWLAILRNFPKIERFGIGAKIDQYFLKLLEILRLASFSSIEEKIRLLSSALKIIDAIRFFLQLCFESRLISAKGYSVIGTLIENIGKETNGWKKYLETKTSRRDLHWQEEKK